MHYKGLTALAALLLWISLLATGMSYGADSPMSADTVLAAAQTALQQAHWNDAGILFEDLLARFPNSPKEDTYLLGLGKSRYYSGQIPSALGTLEELISRFPTSSLRPSALYFSANALYKSSQRDRALGRYVEAFGQSHDPRLDRLVIASLSSFAASKLVPKLEATTTDILSAKRKCELAKALADRATEKRLQTDADQLRAICGGAKEVVPAPPAATGIGEACDIAVLVPLSGEYQSFGQDMFDGISVAVSSYRRESGKQITLTPYDTKGDPIVAARLVRELADSPTDAIVGPLTSDEAAVASATLNCKTIPMIAPTATEAGLTLLSDCSFQLSPNIELQGVQMAEYAYTTLHADSAVVICPATTEQVEMARAFMGRFKALGGKIVAIEYYRSRDRDYGNYIKDVKGILLGHRADSATFLDDKGDTLSSDATPAQVDCLFMPGSPDEVRLLLPQLRFYNLTGAYLGSDGWGDETVYSLGDDVIRGAVFPSPFVRTTRSSEYVRFSDQFNATFARKPSRVAGLGYDAARVLTMALARGASTRQQLIDQIGATSGYDGVEGKVSFGVHRENIEMPLYKITGGQPVLLTITRAAGH